MQLIKTNLLKSVYINVVFVFKLFLFNALQEVKLLIQCSFRHQEAKKGVTRVSHAELGNKKQNKIPPSYTHVKFGALPPSSLPDSHCQRHHSHIGIYYFCGGGKAHTATRASSTFSTAASQRASLFAFH
jgi:hypothetical protein